MLKKISPALIEEAKKDSKILAEIIDSLWQPIFRFLFKKTLDLEKAKRLTQRTFIELSSKVKKFKPKDDTSLAVLAYKIAIEKSKEKRSLFGKPDQGEIKFGTEDVSYVKNEFEEAMRQIFNSPGMKEAKKILESINSAHKDAVVLFYLEQESIEDTAKILDKPVSSIKAILAKAVNKIENIV